MLVVALVVASVALEVLTLASEAATDVTVDPLNSLVASLEELALDALAEEAAVEDALVTELAELFVLGSLETELVDESLALAAEELVDVLDDAAVLVADELA
ncbi:hypothetical protein PET01_18810 [Pediococcus ethanolidurans]|nr:hypothetical protein PET01_18810 [Pediococcus ethanolidurans]